MNINNKITEKKNDIIRSLAILERDSRFNELVDILKQKEITLDESFLKKTEKTDMDWREYYAELCLFLEQDVMLVMKIYDRHKGDDLSIYDDSTKEINQELLAKEQEIRKCIQNTEDSYHDETLMNYINVKYKLIMEKFQSDLQDIIARNRIAIKNQLTDNHQEIMPLTTYSDCTLVKQRCLDELVEVLDDFINYVNSLMENKRLILEQENLIDEVLKKINSATLSHKFKTIKDKYYQSITNIASIDTQIGVLQKNYFEDLKHFYEQVQAEEEKYQAQQKVTNFLNDLTGIVSLYTIEFAKLIEISNYLETNNNYELYQLWIKTCYEVIKLELYHNNGKSILYKQLNEKAQLTIERLYLNDIKEREAELEKLQCYEEFLTEDFNLKVLKKYIDLDLDKDKRLREWQLATYLLSLNMDIKEPSSQTIIDYQCFNNGGVFDDNGEALIRVDFDYYVVNRNGKVKQVYLFKDPYYKSHHYYNLKYHDGVLMYKYVAEGCCFYDLGLDWQKTYHIIAGGEDLLGHEIYARLTDGTYQDGKIRIKDFGEYSDGLIKIKNINDGNSYFIDKTGKIRLTIKNKFFVSDDFHDGYIVTSTKKQDNSIVKEYVNKKGKCCFSRTAKPISKRYNFGNDVSFLEFCNGVAVIGKNFHSEDSIFLDKNFKQVFQDYKYHEIFALPVYGDCRLARLRCLKSKKDGTTYQIGKDGQLIPMTEDEIIKHWIVGNYVLVKDHRGNLSFVEREIQELKCVLDIVEKVDKKHIRHT